MIEKDKLIQEEEEGRENRDERRRGEQFEDSDRQGDRVRVADKKCRREVRDGDGEGIRRRTTKPEVRVREAGVRLVWEWV